MKTTFISTSAISAATRSSLMKVQQELADAQKEMTTKRFADVGQGPRFPNRPDDLLAPGAFAAHDHHRDQHDSLDAAEGNAIDAEESCRQCAGFRRPIAWLAHWRGQRFRGADRSPKQARSRPRHDEHVIRHRRLPIGRSELRRKAPHRIFRQPNARQSSGSSKCVPDGVRNYPVGSGRAEYQCGRHEDVPRYDLRGSVQRPVLEHGLVVGLEPEHA